MARRVDCRRGGAEYASTQNLTARVEYDYVDLGSDTYFLAPPPVPTPQLDFTSSIVKVGFNYRF